MKLKTHLRQSTIEQLQAIAEFWGLTPADSADVATAEALADWLYPRMQTPANFRLAFEQLSTEDRDKVYFLALHGGELPAEEMRRRCHIAGTDAFTELCDRLQARGFMWRERERDPLINLDLVGVPEPFVRLVELPPYWQGFLGYYLQELGTDELRTIARVALDERPATRKKQVLVYWLRRKLLDPKTLEQVLARRDPMQLEMFEQILQKNGVCAWKDLLDTGVHKKFDHMRAEKLRELVETSGLVFVLRAAANKYNNLLIVPRDLAYIIQNGYRRDERSLAELSHGNSEHPTLATPLARPSVILDNSNNIMRDLVILCSYIQRYPVKMLNNGGLGRNDLKKIAPLLSHNKTTKYVAFLSLFAMVKKLIIAVGDQWRTSSSLPQWLARGQACYRDLYEFWLTTNEWNEEFVDGDVVHADHYPQNLISITELRKLILRMLEKTPTDTWIDFETFAESLLPQIAIEIPGRFDLTPSDKFNRHPTLIVESIIAETLYWLGAVTLGVADLETARQLGCRPNEAIAPYDPTHPISARLIGGEKMLFFFRLSDSGRQFMARPYLDAEKLFSKMPDPALPLAHQSDSFTVQPNLEIVTPPDLALDKFFQLTRFTDIKKVDVMTTLTLSSDSLRAGLDSGLLADDMIQLLEECSRKALPETVRQMISECQSRHGEVDMGLAGGFLIVNDRMRLEELKANPKIAPAIKDVFDDRLILLNRAADFKKVARELQRMGYMPKIDSDSLYVTTEGLFQVTLRSEELYDLLALIRFAIMMEEEGGMPVFEDRVRPLFARLSTAAQERFNPSFYAESIARAFYGNYEKLMKKLVDGSTAKYRKQLSRLASQVPRGGTAQAAGFKGPNPASEPADILKLLKYAIERETQLRIQYLRSNGDVVELNIEPEAIQGKKIYALEVGQDEHHLYAIDRIRGAAL